MTFPRFAAIVTCGVVLILLPAVSDGGTYGGGDGGHRNPYQISAGAHLQELGATPDDWDRHFVVTADMDAAGLAIEPIGNDTTPFSGEFLGSGHVVRNLAMNSSSSGDVGLFGHVAPAGDRFENPPVIIALGLVYPSVSATASRSTGALVGFLEHGLVLSCFARTGGDARVDGGRFTGGLVGELGVNGVVANCYSTVPVESGDTAGGLVGLARGVVRKSYAANQVDAVTAGGLFGQADVRPGNIGDNFWDAELSEIDLAGTSVDPNSEYVDDSVGLTTAEMRTEEPFTDVGWSFKRRWKIIEGIDSPRLKWEENVLEIFPFFLDGDQLDPPVDTDDIAEGLVVLDSVNKEMTWNIDLLEFDDPAMIDAITAVDSGDPNLLVIDLTDPNMPIDLAGATPLMLTDGQEDHLRQGLWTIIISAGEDPNGHIAGQVVKSHEIEVNKAKIHFGNPAKAPSDNIRINGRLYPSKRHASSLDIINAETLSVELWQDDTIVVSNAIDVAGGKLSRADRYRYRRKRQETNPLHTIVIDFRRNTFVCIMNKVDLRDLDVPFDLFITFGAYEGMAEIHETN